MGGTLSCGTFHKSTPLGWLPIRRYEHMTGIGQLPYRSATRKMGDIWFSQPDIAFVYPVRFHEPTTYETAFESRYNQGPVDKTGKLGQLLTAPAATPFVYQAYSLTHF